MHTHYGTSAISKMSSSQQLRKLQDAHQVRTNLTNSRSVVIFMLFIVIVLLIDVLAILLFLRDALKPGTFLTMNCFQTGFWGGVLILDIIEISKGASSVGIGFSCFIL
jgi:uncharacterized membrane protein